jgi:hypothetical protein
MKRDWGMLAPWLAVGLLVGVAAPGVSWASPAAEADSLTAEEIMRRVAINQEASQAARGGFVYQQNLLIRFLRKSGDLAREEVYDYTVTPTASGTQKTLNHFAGRYKLPKSDPVAHHRPRYEYKEVDIDGDLISDLAQEFASDQKSRDGIAQDLFPLIASQQRRYRFKLVGIDVYGERKVYRLTFRPAPKAKNEDGVPWSGEVLVDQEEFQPVLVTTRLARAVPFVVRTLLGTNLKHLGFKLTYQRVDKGVWFPASYGGEFDLGAVFFYKRRIGISMRNSGFQRAEVESTVSYSEN